MRRMASGRMGPCTGSPPRLRGGLLVSIRELKAARATINSPAGSNNGGTPDVWPSRRSLYKAAATFTGWCGQPLPYSEQRLGETFSG